MNTRSNKVGSQESWVAGIFGEYEVTTIRKLNEKRWRIEARSQNTYRPFWQKLLLLAKVTADDVMRDESVRDNETFDLARPKIPSHLKLQAISAAILNEAGIEQTHFEARNELVGALATAIDQQDTTYRRFVDRAIAKIEPITADY